jgi:hypothetical protein
MKKSVLLALVAMVAAIVSYGQSEKIDFKKGYKIRASWTQDTVYLMEEVNAKFSVIADTTISLGAVINPQYPAVVIDSPKICFVVKQLSEGVYFIELQYYVGFAGGHCPVDGMQIESLRLNTTNTTTGESKIYGGDECALRLFTIPYPVVLFGPPQFIRKVYDLLTGWNAEIRKNNSVVTIGAVHDM